MFLPLPPLYRLAGLLGALCCTGALAAQQTTERASVDALGGEAKSRSAQPSLSDDGRSVVFSSVAGNLVPSDTNSAYDVFVKDLGTGAIQRASVSSAGAQGNGHSGSFPSLNGPLDRPAISHDGRYVAFSSDATNLVPSDTNGATDIFVFDRQTQTAVRASLSLAGSDSNGPSYFPAVTVTPTGSLLVAYESWASDLVPNDANGTVDVFRTEVATNTTLLMSLSMAGTSAAGTSGGNLHDGPDISDDGLHVAFWSSATDLVPGDTGNYGSGPPYCLTCGDDVFVWSATTGGVVRVSVPASGIEADNASYNPSISADGRWVAFDSRASNLLGPGGDTNGFTDIFVHDRDADGNGVFDEPGGIGTSLASVGPGGAQGNSFSGGGGWAYGGAALSPDATAVAFSSAAGNLVAGDTNGKWDVFVRQLPAGPTARVNVASSGAQSANHGFAAAVSLNASSIAFASAAADLAPGDTNGVEDAFVRRSCAPPPATYCTAKTNSLGCVPAMSWTGRPSATAGSGFDLRSTNTLNKKSGLLLYSLAGSASQPFQGGFLCVKAPVSRTPPTYSGGSPLGQDCTGILSFDFNAFVATGANPALVAGQAVRAQFWSRDPNASFGSNLSDAAAFALCD
jgi:Tol biopolymer transport system component